jgi:hypothetical protein
MNWEAQRALKSLKGTRASPHSEEEYEIYMAAGRHDSGS